MRLRDLKANDYFMVTFRNKHLNCGKPFSLISQVVNHEESPMRTLIKGPTGAQFYFPNTTVIKVRLISKFKEETNNASN